MITFSLLGAGRIGRVHANNVCRHPAARLSLIYDVDESAARSLADKVGAGVASSPDQIFQDGQVDAVIIGTPAETHASFVEDAARAGKAIFCEKPIDKDLVRTRQCLDIVKAHGVTLFLAFQRRFDPSFAALRRRLLEGEVGTPEMLFLTSRDPAPPPIEFVRRSGGLFRDMMIHDFDMAQWLLGAQPTKVFAVGGCFASPAIRELGFADTAVVTMTLESGVIANINCAMRATYGYDQRVEVHGSQGMLAIGNRYETSVRKFNQDGIGHELPLHFFIERYAQAYINELDYFIECLNTGRQPSPNGEDGFRSLQLAEAAHRSWLSGRPIELSEVSTR